MAIVEEHDVPARALHELATGLDSWDSLADVPEDIRMRVAEKLMRLVIDFTPVSERGNIVAVKLATENVIGANVTEPKTALERRKMN